MSQSIFEEIYNKEIEGKNLPAYSIPISFKSYASKLGQFNYQTAQKISINSLSQLDKFLYDHKTMVLRLGRSKTEKGTNFMVIKLGDNIEDLHKFFLVDSEIFRSEKIKSYIPEGDYRTLFPFRLIPEIKETEAVALGFASGLFQHALSFDELKMPYYSSGGHATYTFEFGIDPGLKEGNQPKLFLHNSGQVEIDHLLYAERNGYGKLFLFEAKFDYKEDPNASLAKHKLFYPYMGLKQFVPEDIEIIPIYVRIFRQDPKVLIYNICECSFNENDYLLTNLTANIVKRYVLIFT